jgi:hypothetical protein
MAEQRVPGLVALRVIMICTIVSTALHYTDNYVQVDRYPRPNGMSLDLLRTGVAVSWPVLTAFGIAGCLLYTRRRLWGARACLAIYAITGLITLGHFLNGVPQVAWYWFATLFTDAAGGLALWIFVGWSLKLDSTPLHLRVPAIER